MKARARAEQRAAAVLKSYTDRGVPEKPAILAGIRELESRGAHHAQEGRWILGWLKRRLAKLG